MMSMWLLIIHNVYIFTVEKSILNLKNWIIKIKYTYKWIKIGQDQKRPTVDRKIISIRKK